MHLKEISILNSALMLLYEGELNPDQKMHYGASTRKLIKRFQKSIDKPTCGVVDKELWNMIMANATLVCLHKEKISHESVE